MSGPIGRLHVVVDDLTLAQAALEGGADVIQVRIKTGTDRERLAMITSIVERCDARGVRCIVNDRVDLALAAHAGGVHVGSEDLPVPVVRFLLGPHAIVGATARDAATARVHERDGADYIGVGPCYATSTKLGLPTPIGPDGVTLVATAVDLPVIAIAGVTAARVAELVAAGAWGVAVIGAVAGAADPRLATAELVAALKEAA